MQKIMFNDKYGLTMAVLTGQKSMTRRAISPKVWEKYKSWLGGMDGSREYLISLAPYKVGEVVAIAQPYNDIPRLANYPELQDMSDYAAGYNNKMFVRAEDMQHHIKITDIRVERLKDISDEDCLKEGIKPCNFGKKFTPGDRRAYNTPREAFAALIDKVGKKGDWDSNPWVFVYNFKIVD